MRRTNTIARAAAIALTLLGMAASAAPSYAFRMIQNTSIGRVTFGSQVSCDDSGGFTHWTTADVDWYHNTANQGYGKSEALRNAMTSWTDVANADHMLTYRGTTDDGWATDNRNTVLWATDDSCTGTCLALTALVLQSGQRIVESDIIFNDSWFWTTGKLGVGAGVGTGGETYDTEAVAAHEFGHSLGIHHTQFSSPPIPTMYMYYFGLDERTLEEDDRSALQCAQNRYPFGVDNAQFIDQSVPTSLTPGETAAAWVTMKNTGSSTWTRSAGYKLGSQNPQGNTRWGLHRVWLPSGVSVEPGQQWRFDFTITAPSWPDTYDFQWRMLQEGVRWFGALSTNQRISVQPDPPQTETIYIAPYSDARVEQAQRFTNFGPIPTLTVRETTTGQGRYSLLRFSVPSLSGPVVSAKLRIRTRFNPIPDVALDRVDNTSVGESWITWDTWDTNGFTLTAAGSGTGLQGNAWHAIDVTAGVAGNGTTELGLVTANGPDWEGQDFWSRESAYPPVLEVTSGTGPVRTFFPVADAWIDQDSPLANHGSSAELRIRPADSGRTKYSILRFAVSGISGGVQSAVLHLRTQETFISEVSVLQPRNIQWSEGSINFENWNQNGLALTFLGSAGPLAANTYHELDVTSAVSGGGDLVLRLTTSQDTASLHFWSDESSFSPELIVTYMR